MESGIPSERERGGLSTKALTVFVANLPESLDIHGLRGVFSVAGEIREVTIPFNQGFRRKFGFVRFAKVESVRRSINLINSKIVRGCRLFVQEAKSEKKQSYFYRNGNYLNNRLYKDGGRKFTWRKPPEEGRVREEKLQMRSVGLRNPVVDSEIFRKEKQPRRVCGVANNRNFEWLINSLMGECDDFCDLTELSSWLVKEVEELVKVRKIQWNQYLLQFASPEAANSALQNSLLKEKFQVLRSWSWYDVCSSRPVWLEVTGIPPLGWKTENFNQIVGKWGNFVCLSKDLSEVVCYDSMKVLIITDVLNRIDEHIIFDLEGKGFDVHIKEVESWSLMEDMSGILAKPAHTPEASGTHMESLMPEIPEGVQENVRVQNEEQPTQSMSSKKDRIENRINLESHHVNRDSTKSPEVEVSEEELISEDASATPRINDIEESISISTRVEETQLNVVEQLDRQAGGINEVINDTISHIGKQKGLVGGEGFNEENLISVNNTSNEEEGEEVEGIQNINLVDTGIEAQKRKKKAETKKKKATHTMGKANRFHESARRLKEASKKAIEGTYDSTPESIKEKARKAVEFGNLVGLKAKRNVDGAVRRITNTLKG